MKITKCRVKLHFLIICVLDIREQVLFAIV